MTELSIVEEGKKFRNLMEEEVMSFRGSLGFMKKFPVPCRLYIRYDMIMGTVLMGDMDSWFTAMILVRYTQNFSLYSLFFRII